MPEAWVISLIAVGGLVLLAGWGWLLVRAFRTHWVWGVAVLAGVGAPVFALARFGRAWPPLLVLLLGTLVAAAGPAYNLIVAAKPPDKAVVRQTSITLTRANPEEFEKLKANTGWKTIQADATPFTDADWAVLDGMSELEFISLNDTPVTDATLERLAKLPKLQKVFAARSKMTADGVKRLILDNPDSTVMEIDFRGLTPPVPGKALRDWQAKDQENRKFNN